LRAGRKIVARFSGDGDYALFVIVPILPMAATRSIEIPAVILHEFDHVADFHRFDPDNCVFLGQLRTPMQSWRSPASKRGALGGVETTTYFETRSLRAL
jgi:hypothetical protein